MCQIGAQIPLWVGQFLGHILAFCKVYGTYGISCAMHWQCVTDFIGIFTGGREMITPPCVRFSVYFVCSVERV